MTFTEAIKKEAEEKFQQLEAGTAPSPITSPTMDSFSQFEQKSKRFHERLAAQDNDVKRAFDTINANRSNRIAAELAAKKKAEAEALAAKKKAEEAEKAKKKAEEDRRLAILRAEREAKERKAAIIKFSVIGVVAIAVIIGLIFGIIAIVNGVKASNERKAQEEAANYSIDNIEIVVTKKESTISYGWSTKYENVFHFTITNNCQKTIEYIEGKMSFFEGETHIGDSTVKFTSSIDPTRSSNMTVDFSGSEDVYAALYSTAFDKMKIEYKITNVTFQDHVEKTYDEGYKVIKAPADDLSKGPFADIKYAAVGDIVELGKFESNGDFYATEDIEWIVVKIEGDKALLISKMALVTMPYGDYSQEDYVSWKNSEIRNFLNGTFYYNCFTDAERALILSTTNTPSEEEIALGALETSDKIFIPTADELCEMFYSTNDMHCLATGNIWSESMDTGVGSISNDEYNTGADYWLRDCMADYLYGMPGQGVFSDDSTFSGTTYFNDSNYVRPCIWVDLSSIE